jgi:hypothetical protein
MAFLLSHPLLHSPTLTSHQMCNQSLLDLFLDQELQVCLRYKSSSAMRAHFLFHHLRCRKSQLSLVSTVQSAQDLLLMHNRHLGRNQLHLMSSSQ